MKQIIGVTGGIASGKSNVCNVIKELGFKVIDLDEITHLLYQKGNSIYEAILKNFGLEYLDSNEEIDRKKLGKLIFQNQEAKEKLNSITHPLILARMKEEMDKLDDKIIFLDIPLLFEAKLEYLCDKIICVYLEESLQVKRLMERDHIDYDYAMQKIHSQMDLNIKKDKADYVIHSKGSLDETKALVKTIINEIKGE